MREVSHPLGEELQVRGPALHDRADAVLEQGLGQVHVVGQGRRRPSPAPPSRTPRRGGAVSEGSARKVGPKVYTSPRDRGKGFGRELARDRQIGLLAEEVRPPALAPQGLARGQGGHPEHLARALAVRPGEDGRVQVDEAPVVEEAVDGQGQFRADAEQGPVLVGAGPQVGDGSVKTRRSGASSEAGSSPGPTLR